MTMGVPGLWRELSPAAKTKGSALTLRVGKLKFSVVQHCLATLGEEWVDVTYRD